MRNLHSCEITFFFIMVCQAPGWTQQQDKKCRVLHTFRFPCKYLIWLWSPIQYEFEYVLRINYSQCPEGYSSFSRETYSNSFQHIHKETQAYTHDWIKAGCWLRSSLLIMSLCVCRHRHISRLHGSAYLFHCTSPHQFSLQLSFCPFSSTTCHIHSQNQSALKTTSLTFLNLLA